MYRVNAVSNHGHAFSVSVFSYVNVVKIYTELVEGNFHEVEVLDPDQIYITI